MSYIQYFDDYNVGISKKKSNVALANEMFSGTLSFMLMQHQLATSHE